MYMIVAELYNRLFPGFRYAKLCFEITWDTSVREKVKKLNAEIW